MASTTEQFLEFLECRARVLRTEPWYWSYVAWRFVRGYAEVRPEWT